MPERGAELSVYKHGPRWLGAIKRQTEPIPIFWEPTSQDGKPQVAGMNANGVRYVGHWKIVQVDDHTDSPFIYNDIQRIATIHLRFHNFNDDWDKVIEYCKEKTPEEIKSTSSLKAPKAIETPLKRSALITRKQLACLTGGKVDGFEHENTLNVGTPVTFCGGSALGIRDGIVHHICLKSDQNTKMPSTKDTFSFSKQRMKTGNERCVRVLKDQDRAIPIFWEPALQKGSAKGVEYVGHWIIRTVEDHVHEPFVEMGKERIAKISLDFNHFNDEWDNIIGQCEGKSPEEIKSMDFTNQAINKSAIENNDGEDIAVNLDVEDVREAVEKFYEASNPGLFTVRRAYKSVINQLGIRLTKEIRKVIKDHHAYLLEQAEETREGTAKQL